MTTQPVAPDPAELLPSLGAHIRTLRERSGLSQVALVQRAAQEKIPGASALALYEQDRRAPMARYLLWVLESLGADGGMREAVIQTAASRYPKRYTVGLEAYRSGGWDAWATWARAQVPKPTGGGNPIVAISLSESEIALVHRVVPEGVTVSDWVRSMLQVVLRDRTVSRHIPGLQGEPRPPSVQDVTGPAESRTKTLAVRLPAELMLAVEAARGIMPLKMWLRTAVLTAATLQEKPSAKAGPMVARGASRGVRGAGVP